MKKLFLLLFPLLLISCSSNKYVWINYSVNNVPMPAKMEPIPINVNFHILSDNRANIEDNKILFAQSHMLAIDGKEFCVNSEQYYRKDSVVTQISRLFVKHANKVKLFTQTSLNENINNGYYLSGTLNNFYGKQEYPTATNTITTTDNSAANVAVAGALLGGVVGGLMESSAYEIKTPGKIIIEMSDLKLVKNNGALVKDFGVFFQEYKGYFKVDGNCGCIYENVNVMLKDFHAKLIEKIREELAREEF